MTRIASVFLALMMFVAPFSVSAQEPSAQDIIDRALDRNSMGFQSGMATIQLSIQDAKGVQLNRSLEIRSRKIGDKARTLVKLTAPKEVHGQSFLFAEGEKENDVWMYLPAFKVTRRIEGGQKDGSFLGSHFTYADFESRDVKNATHTRLPDAQIGNVPTYVIESKPSEKTSDYGKVMVWVRKSDDVPLRIRFFDHSDKVVKTLFIEKLEKSASGQTYAKQMTLRAEAGGHTTILIENLSEAELPEAIFSKDQLGK